jgi:hypothetical protein
LLVFLSVFCAKAPKLSSYGLQARACQPTVDTLRKDFTGKSQRVPTCLRRAATPSRPAGYFIVSVPVRVSVHFADWLPLSTITLLVILTARVWPFTPRAPPMTVSV